MKNFTVFLCASFLCLAHLANAADTSNNSKKPETGSIEENSDSNKKTNPKKLTAEGPHTKAAQKTIQKLESLLKSADFNEKSEISKFQTLNKAPAMICAIARSPDCPPEAIQFLFEKLHARVMKSCNRSLLSFLVKINLIPSHIAQAISKKLYSWMPCNESDNATYILSNLIENKLMTEENIQTLFNDLYSFVPDYHNAAWLIRDLIRNKLLTAKNIDTLITGLLPHMREFDSSWALSDLVSIDLLSQESAQKLLNGLKPHLRDSTSACRIVAFLGNHRYLTFENAKEILKEAGSHIVQDDTTNTYWIIDALIRNKLLTSKDLKTLYNDLDPQKIEQVKKNERTIIRRQQLRKLIKATYPEMTD